MNKLPRTTIDQARQLSADGVVHAVTGVSSTSVVPTGAKFVRATQTVGGGTEDIFFLFGAAATINGAGTTVLSRAFPQQLYHVPSDAATLAAISTGAISMFLEYFD